MIENIKDHVAELAAFEVGEVVTVVEPTSSCKGETGQVVRVVDDVVMVRLHGVALSFGVNELGLTDTMTCHRRVYPEDQCGERAIATDLALVNGVCADCIAYERSYSPAVSAGIVYLS